jgi:hypothetical protein
VNSKTKLDAISELHLTMGEGRNDGAFVRLL